MYSYMCRCIDIIYIIHNARYVHQDIFVYVYCSFWTVKVLVCSFAEIPMYFK